MAKRFFGLVVVATCTATACSTRDAQVTGHPLPTASAATPNGTAAPAPPAQKAGPPSTMEENRVFASAEQAGLRLTLTLAPDERVDRVPLRVLELEFTNTSAEPLRIYMPASEPFRAGISSVVIVGTDAVIAVPEPRPHGYVVTEKDFPLLQPGQSLRFEQSFTLDPMSAGAGTQTKRRDGFASGTHATIHWTYKNTITRWQGGVPTFDGRTQQLFGGGDIPYIWTGKLELSAPWTIP